MSDIQLDLTINTGALQGKYLHELQKIVDLVTFGMASMPALTQEAYQSYLPFWSVHPAGDRRMSFEEAAEAAEHWYVKHCLLDAIDTVNAFLEEVWLVCQLYQLATRNCVLVSDYNQIVDAGRRKFHRLGLPEKIRRIKEGFGVESDFDAHVVSINQARNCLVHRLGVVSKEDVDENDELVVRWRTTKIIATSLDGTAEHVIEGPYIVEGGWTVAVHMSSGEKVFRIGERVVLTYRELTFALFSLLNFVLAIPKAVDQYGVRMGVVSPPPVGCNDSL